MTSATETPSQSEMPTGVRALYVLTLIYGFLVGVSLLESGIKVMGADTHRKSDVP